MRKPIDTRIDPTLHRPVATPIDSYVEPGPSSLRGLADSLGKLNGSLSGLLDKRKAKDDEEGKLKGEAQFLKDNAEGYAEGVRTDAIPAHSSPAFVEGYKNASGYVAGGAFRTDFDAKLNEALPSLDTPEKYDAFVADYISKAVDPEADAYTLKGLLPQIKALHGEGYAKFTDYRSKAVYAGSTQAHGAMLAQTIDKAEKDGLSEVDGPDYDAVGEAADLVRDTFIETGGSVADADKMVIDTITAKAANLKDRDLLKVLNRKVPGKDYTYAETPAGVAAVSATHDAIDVMERRDASEKTEAYNREVKIEGDKARSAITIYMANNRGAPIPDGMLANARKYDDTIDAKIAEWRKNISAGWTDPDVMKNLFEDIRDDPDNAEATITKALEGGRIGRHEDIKAADDYAKSVKAAKPKIEAITEDSAFKQTMSDIDFATKGKNDMMEPIAGTSLEGRQAQYDFKMAMVQWVMENPNATYRETQKAIADTSASILGRIKPPTDITEAGTYDRPEGAAQDVSQAPFANPYVDKPEDGKAKADDAELMDDAKTLLNGQTPEQRAVWDERAKERGMSTEDYVAAILKGKDMSVTGTEGDDEPDAPSPEEEEEAIEAQPKAKPISFKPGESQREEGQTQREPGASDGVTTGRGFTRKTAMKLLQKALALPDEDDPDYGEFSEASLGGDGKLPDVPDPGAAKLLSLIYKHEAAGNYNAVFGNAKSTRDLSKMSLNQVLASQVAARRRGAKSTAIGAPQFIYKTLRGLKDELGLSGNEPFDKKLQDRLAMALLNRRGWREFKAGKISRNEFALRLSQEWASLPNPNTGRSYYHGDGLNASRIKPSQVYAALGFKGGPNLDAGRSILQTLQGPEGTGRPVDRVYNNVPENEVEQFREWNPDPVGNHEANLAEVDPDLQQVVKLAQTYSTIPFVVGSGKRTPELQAKAKEWGWSKTDHSDHLHGEAVDLWALDDSQAVTFDKGSQKKIMKAMKRAARELGFELDAGGDWTSFKDMPHFAVKRKAAGQEA